MARKSIHEKIFSKSPAQRSVGEVALATGDFSLLPEFGDGGQLPNVVLPAAKEKYRTLLTDTEKPQFENWRSQLPKNLQYDRDYDLQGLWKENPNVKPTANLHFTDKYKRPNHPTFSNESQYFNPRTKQTAGHWQETPNEWDYIPYDETVKQPIVEKKMAEGGETKNAAASSTYVKHPYVEEYPENMVYPPVTVTTHVDKETRDFFDLQKKTSFPRYQALTEMGREHGFSKVRHDNNFGARASYTDWPGQGSTIHLSKDKITGEGFSQSELDNIQAGSDANKYIAELAHKKQFDKDKLGAVAKWLGNDMIDYIKKPFTKRKNRQLFLESLKTGNDNSEEIARLRKSTNPYQDKNALEYEAHSIIEPKLKKEFDDRENKVMTESYKEGGAVTPTVTNDVRGEWNNYVGWLASTGKKGSPDLDVNQGGFKTLDEYRKYNPNTFLTKDYVLPIQQDFQKYRDWSISQHKAGKLKMAGDPGPNYENFMPELSITDGYPGSKTTSHSFPHDYMNFTNEDNQSTITQKGFAVAKMKDGGKVIKGTPLTQPIAESTGHHIFIPNNVQPHFGANDTLQSTESFTTDKRSRSQIVKDRSKSANSILTKASAIGEMFPATRIPATALGLVLGANSVVDDIQTGNNDELPIDIAGMLPGVPLKSSMRLPAKQAAKYAKSMFMLNVPKIIGTAGDLTDNGKDFGIGPKMAEGGTVLNGEGLDGDAAMMAGANALPGIMSAFDPNASAATKGSGIGSGIGGIAGTVLGGPIGGMIGSTLGGVVGGMIGGHPEEKLRQKRYAETAARKYNKLDLSFNADPYGQNTSFYAEDGGQAPGQQSAAPTRVNIEKGELAVDPNSFEVIRKFENKNRYAKHAANSFKEPIGNHVELPAGTIIIPRKNAETYEKGSKLTRKSILANLLKDQANREHAEGLENKMAYGGDIDNLVDPPPVTVTGYRNKKRAIGLASINSIHNPLESELPNNDEARVMGVHNPLVSDLPNGPEPVTPEGFKMPHISSVAASQALGLAPTIMGIANAYGNDPYLNYDDNSNGFARAESYVQQIPTDLNIEPAKAAMTRTARGYTQQLNNTNSPSIRAENASNFTKVINATGELYANADNERKNRIAAKLGQLANLKVQQGTDQEQALGKYSTELRMDKANREGLVQRGLSEGVTNISKGIMDKERIKSLNAMAKYFKLDPTGKQLIAEDPNAVQHIVDQLNGGFVPNFAVPAAAGKTSTTTQRDARGRIKQTSQTVKGK